MLNKIIEGCCDSIDSCTRALNKLSDHLKNSPKNDINDTDTVEPGLYIVEATVTSITYVSSGNPGLNYYKCQAKRLLEAKGYTVMDINITKKE